MNCYASILLKCFLNRQSNINRLTSSPTRDCAPQQKLNIHLIFHHGINFFRRSVLLPICLQLAIMIQQIFNYLFMERTFVGRRYKGSIPIKRYNCFFIGFRGLGGCYYFNSPRKIKTEIANEIHISTNNKVYSP